MDSQTLNKLIQDDAKSGGNKYETEDQSIINRFSRICFIVGTLFAAVLSAIQSFVTGHPNFGLFSVVFLVFSVAQIYKSYYSRTLKKDLLLILLEVIAFITFTCIYLYQVFNSSMWG